MALRGPARGARVALAAGALGICAAVALVLYPRQQPLALLGNDEALARMLANEPYAGGALSSMLSGKQGAGAAGKRGPEIPDPHPDPDPYPYPGHPARSPVRGEAADSTTAPANKARGAATTGLAHKTTGLSLTEDRNGEYASPALGRAHGCKPSPVTFYPGDDCDPLAAIEAPAIAAWQHNLAVGNPTKGGVHWTAGDTRDPRMDLTPRYGVHGGDSGLLFDRTYDAKGLFHTMYKPIIGWQPRDTHIGTKGAPMQLAARHARAAPAHAATAQRLLRRLVKQGDADMALGKADATAAPRRSEALLKEATRLYDAAFALGKQQRAHTHAPAAAAPRAPRRGRAASAAGGLMHAVDLIAASETQLRHLARSIASSADYARARASRDARAVRGELGKMGPPRAAPAAGAPRQQALAKVDADPYLNPNPSWGYQVPPACPLQTGRGSLPRTVQNGRASVPRNLNPNPSWGYQAPPLPTVAPTHVPTVHSLC
jgi:hypothetical protein